MNFCPNIFFLYGKILFIFFLCWSVGKCVFQINTKADSTYKWILCSVFGAVVINLSVATAVVLNFPGFLGMIWIVPILLNRIKEILVGKNKVKINLGNPFFVVSLLTVLNYTAPFLIQGTSGLYARGGGDHSTYLGLSEYFSLNGLWGPIKKDELNPPQPYWEVKTYPVSMQKFLSSLPALDLKHNLPLGNQMIASGFIALLPGESDETYSAAIAFYCSMAVCSTIALCFVFSGGWGGISWLCFILLPLSNLLLYPSGTHSIPFIFAISILNTLLITAYQTDLTQNKSLFKQALPAGGLAAGLLTIYPFLVPVFLAYLPILFLIQKNPVVPTFFFGLKICLVALLLTHIYLLINLPLILFGIGAATPLYPPMSLLQFLATQSGIVDFLGLAPQKQITSKEITSLVFTGISVIFCGIAIWKKNNMKMLVITSLFVFFAGAAVYYNLKNSEGLGGYQMVRLGVVSHAYLLGLAGVGMSVWLNESQAKKKTCLAVLLLFSFFCLRERFSVINEIISTPHAFATEFRDSFAYKVRRFIKEKQEEANIKKLSRVVYYFGHGDGTDFGGSTVFLRSVFALNSFNLESILASNDKKLWNTNWLNGALLLYNPISQNEIINDKRSKVSRTPILNNKRISLWDSENSKISAVIGESWNYPIEYTCGESHKSFRYLRGKTGVLVIWTNEEEEIQIETKVSADSEGSFLKIRSLENGKEWKNKVNRWKGNYEQVTDFTIKTNLNPGPNVFEFVPEKYHGLSPWLLLFEIKIVN